MIRSLLNSFIILLFIFPLTTSSLLHAAPIKKNQYEDNLAKLIQSKCEMEVAPLLSFPDGFQSQTGFTYCDAAFAFDQHKHANAAYLFYRANNILGYGVPKKSVRSINHFLMPASDPYDHSLRNIKVRAQNNDAWALLELARLAYSDEIKTDISQLPTLGSPELMRLLFMETEIFLKEVNNWEVFEKHLDTYLENVWQLSGEYTFYAASKLLAVLDEFDRKEDFLASTFDIPEHLCIKILAALSFTDAADKDFVWLLRLRVWSPKEVYQTRYLGYEKGFLGQMPKGAEFDYLFTLVELENALSRVRYFTNTPTPEKLDRIKYYESKFPKFRDRFLKYFPLINQSGILEVSSNKVAEIFSELIKNPKYDGVGDFEGLLLADIRAIAAFPHLKEKAKYEYIKLISPGRPYVQKIYEQPTDSLEAYSLNYLATGEFKDANADLNSLAIAMSRFSENSCETQADLACRKKWADVDLSLEIIEGAEGGGCKINRVFKPFIKKQALAGAVDYRIFYFCNFNQMASLFGNSLDQQKNEFPKILYGSGATAYTNALYSEALIMHGGLIATKIYLNSPNKRWLPTPSTTWDLSRFSYPSAWAYFSAVSKGPMPEVSESGPLGPYVNYSSLAEIYTISGNYERALAAQIKSLEHNIYLANEYPDEFLDSVLEHFIKTKHLMRLTKIPETIIEDFIKGKFSTISSDQKLIKYRDQPLGLFKSVSGQTMKKQAMGYLGLVGSPSFEIGGNDFDLEASFDFVRSALTEKDFLKKSCADQNILKALYSPIDETAHYDNMGAAVWFNSPSIGHEFLGFWHQCALNYISKLEAVGHDAEIQRLYNRYISQNVPDYLNNNFNFSEPRSIQTFAFWTKAARTAGSLNGLLMSITATDHIYRQLANSFVYNDSRSLRSNQKYLEQILVDATFAISEFKRQGPNNEFVINHINEKISSLRIAAKLILSSDQKRQRYLGLNQLTDDPHYRRLNNTLTEEHRFWPKVGDGLGVWLKDVDGKIKISNILDGGPAFGLGLAKNDLLIAYDSHFVQEGDSVTSIINWFTKTKPKSVTLTVQKPDGRKLSREIKNTGNWFELGLQNQLRKELFLSINNQADNANGPISYVKKIAQKGEVEKVKLHFFPYEADAHLSWVQRNSQLKIPIYSLSYSNGNAVLDSIDLDGKVDTKLVALDENEIEKLSRRLIDGGDLSEEEALSACKSFEALSNAAGVLRERAIIFVPSVNLFPIPAEIIFGTYCFSKSTAIVQASDVTGAINFSRYQSDVKMPSNFVGVGNPLVVKSSANNIFSSLFRGEAAKRAFQGMEQNFQPLPDAEEEIKDIADYFVSKDVYLTKDASILVGLDKASQLSITGKTVAITLATHGVPLNVEDGIYMPSLLSIEGGKTKLISNSMVETASIQNSTVVLSACDTAAGLAETRDLMFTGFVESFANAGSRLIVASLWPVHSYSSRVISTSFFSNWKTKNLISAISNAKNSVNERVRSLPFVYLVP
jgi:hypothetical protein